MPRILAPGGEVDWPAEEGALGVVGVAPWATLEFCSKLYEAVRVSRDWHYPRLIVDINTKIPSRGRHLQLGETDPSAAIAATIRELASQGATIAVVACNTAHILYDRWAPGAPIPVLHIVHETVAYAQRIGATQIVPLVSASMAQHDLYGRIARQAGLRCARPGAQDQAVVCRLIEAVKTTGRLGQEGEQSARALLARQREVGVDTVVGGCTELSVLAETCAALGMGFVDSNVALARAALRDLGLAPGRVVEAHDTAG